MSIVDCQDQGLDQSVNQTPRRCVDAISAIDNASGLISGVGLTDDDQDGDFEVVNQHSLKSAQKITRVRGITESAGIDIKLDADFIVLSYIDSLNQWTQGGFLYLWVALQSLFHFTPETIQIYSRWRWG